MNTRLTFAGVCVALFPIRLVLPLNAHHTHRPHPLLPNLPDTSTLQPAVLPHILFISALPDRLTQ